MTEITKELEIQNKKGLHARAAAAFVKTLEPFDIEVNVDGKSVNVLVAVLLWA